MLRSQEELRDFPEAAEPYMDPILRFNRRAYLSFLRRLYKLCFWHFTISPKETAGLFFVKKLRKKKIRMIIDARRGKRRFRDPSGVELLSSEGFARVEVEVEEGLHIGSEAWQEALSLRMSCHYRGLLAIRLLSCSVKLSLMRRWLMRSTLGPRESCS